MTRVINKDLYRIYKPFRNHLNSVAIENALYVIWAYVNNFQFGQDFPRDIEVHPSVLSAVNVPSRGVYEWDLALLAREIIMNGQENLSLATRNFNSWSYFSDGINKLKNFENKAWPIFGGVPAVMNEFRRISHRQFPWQFKLSSADFVRYFKIYNSARISEIVRTKLGLTVQQWYTIGTAIAGAILTNPKMNIDPEIIVSGITKKEFDIFLSLTSTNITGIREIIERDVKFDDQFFYTLNPLEYYPLISIGQHYYCPLINFLMWRITSGLYFDLVNDKNFGHPFGLAFQDYLLEISQKILDPEKTEVIPEQKYKVGKDEEDSIDIILSQKESAFFVEAKAKRLQAKSKSQLLSEDAINKDLEILAEDVAQVYATIHDHKNGHYKHFRYNESVKIYPLVVTLEDWFLMGDNVKSLEERVKEKLKEKDIPLIYIDDIPYTVCSTKNYEQLVQVLNKNKITEIMSKWMPFINEGHNFGNFLIKNYGEGCKYIDDFFPGDFEKIYPEKVMNP